MTTVTSGCCASEGLFRYFLHYDHAQLRSPDVLRLRQTQQALADDVQVRERTGGEQPVGVLVDPPVAHFGEAEKALDDMKGMLNPCTNSGLGAVGLALSILQRAVPMRFVVGEVERRRGTCAHRLTLPAIGGIAPHSRFCAMQQVVKQLAVVDVSGRGRGRVNEPFLTVDADMPLHAEVPLVAFLRLVHLRITRPIAVLGRTRRMDNGGIHNGASRDLEAVRGQISIDGLQQLCTQFMRLQQVAELAYRRLVRRWLTAQIDADKSPQRARIVERFLHRRVGQVEPLLQEVDPQHAFETDRRTTGAAARLRIHRLDQCAQLRPWDDLLHLGRRVRLRNFSKFSGASVCWRIPFGSVWRKWMTRIIVD